MQKSDIKELHRQIKSKNSAIRQIYGLYVTGENEEAYESINMTYSLDIDSAARQISFLANVVNTSGYGKTVFPVRLESQPDKLNEIKGKDKWTKDDLEWLKQKLLEFFPHTEPYYAVVAQVRYDITSKSDDSDDNNDDSYVYNAILAGICPSKLTPAALGYTGAIEELMRQWTIKKPITGFLYPGLDYRTEERNEALLYSKDPSMEVLFPEIFDFSKTPVSSEEQKSRFSNFMEQMHTDTDKTISIHKRLAEENVTGDTEISKTEMRRILNDSDIDTKDFDDVYDETIGNTSIMTSSVSGEIVSIETGSFDLKAPIEHADVIRTQKIDGVRCVLIPIEEDLYINGIRVEECDD